MTPEFVEPAARPFTVVFNGEGQYSVWRSDEAVPLGWSKTAWSGTHAECLARIAVIWTDIRPRVPARADAARDPA